MCVVQDVDEDTRSFAAVSLAAAVGRHMEAAAAKAAVTKHMFGNAESNDFDSRMVGWWSGGFFVLLFLFVSGGGFGVDVCVEGSWCLVCVLVLCEMRS